MKLAVDVEGEEADEQLVLLHHHRERRRVEIGAVRPHDNVDFVDVDQLGVDAGHVGRIGLIVVVDELYFAAEESALGVDLLRPDLGAEQRLLAVGRERSGQRHGEAELDRVAVLRRCGRRRGQAAGNYERGAKACHAAARHVIPHGFLLKDCFFRAGRAKTAAPSGPARVPCATMPCLRGDGKVAKRRSGNPPLALPVEPGRGVCPFGLHEDVTAKARENPCRYRG